MFTKTCRDYKQTPAVSDKVYYSLLNDYGIATTKGFGIYYDNPKEVEKSKLRSEIGCIVENLDSVTIDKLSNKFQIKTQPFKNYITTEFPFKGKLSVMFGIMKVYPALEKYLKEHKYSDSPIMEIYDVPNKGFSGMRRVVARFNFSCTLIGKRTQSLTGHTAARRWRLWQDDPHDTDKIK